MISNLFTKLPNFTWHMYQTKVPLHLGVALCCVVKKHRRQDDTMSPWKKDLLHRRNARALMQECKQRSPKSLKLP